MKKTFLKTGLFLLVCAFAGTAVADILEAANSLYREGRYRQALEIYLHPEFSTDAAVQNRIGTLYLEPSLRDEIKSAEWFKKSAGQGNRYAQFNLGLAYKNGTGVKRDYARAMQLFRQSAKGGYAPAMTAIGALYEEGKDVEKSADDAIKWYTRAADKGDAKAMHRLAEIFRYGIPGQPADSAKAQEWKTKAEATGKKP